MPDSGFLRCTRHTSFFSCSLHNDVRQHTRVSWEEGMTCIYEACYPIIWPAIHYNVSVNPAIRIPTPCSGLLATTNRKIRGSVDILSRVNQHSWERSSGSPRSSNASSTMRIDSQTHVFTSVQRGVINNLSNVISIEGKLHPKSPPTALYIHSAMTDLDVARLYAIVWTTTFTTTYVFAFPFSNSDLIFSLNFSPIILVTVLYPIPAAPVIRIKLRVI